MKISHIWNHFQRRSCRFNILNMHQDSAALYNRILCLLRNLQPNYSVLFS